MRTRNLSQLTNIAIRGLTLVSKFLLIFFLARFLEPGELGVYGLLAATVSYSLYFLGFDFYTYSTRELLKRDRKEWGGLLKAQGALTLVLYVVFLPLLTLIFIGGLLPVSVIGWFFALLVLEHLTQELGRLLVAVSDQLYASLVLFFRSGIWAVLVAGMMWGVPKTRDLDVVLGAWVLGSLVALSLGFSRVWRMRLSGWQQEIDWAWVLKGLKLAFALLIATLAIRALFTLDRYWFGHLAGLDALGAYVLFMGISMALISFLDAGVFAFIYPGLISAHQQGNAAGFRSGMRRLLLQTISFSCIFSVAGLLAVGPLLLWLDRPLYSAQQGLFVWILSATVLYAVGMVPHFGLYAQGHDRPIIHSHIVSLIVFVLATWIFAQFWPQLAVPLGLCISFFFVLCWKAWSFHRLTPAPYRLFQS
ncbi:MULTISPECIES: lipopolysaccharide biosynthesis protein [Pseudomonas]|uniref:lipopolysaccharide biosynthesis protein n=1 Tax=Pseudomonas TaxID=286 RepID=UPI00069F1470|nr:MULTISPECIES: oligosaccharide flippase family protein [Pseudomonas]MCE0460219.1 oligosaccharide flippase family protein [Pseudomonas uvaldensis]